MLTKPAAPTYTVARLRIARVIAVATFLLAAPAAKARPAGSHIAPPGSSVPSPGPAVRVVAAQPIAEKTGGTRAGNKGPGGQDAEKGKSKGKSHGKG